MRDARRSTPAGVALDITGEQAAAREPRRAAATGALTVVIRIEVVAMMG
jgi:hypothetical protein